MKRLTLPLVLLAAMASSALANSKLLILHSEGRADVKTRAKVDGAIVRVARTGPEAITPGEITFSEAAAMIGCRAEDAACATEVAQSLGVDEVVIVTVTPKPPDGYEVKVRRAGKTPKDATTVVAVDKLDRLDALAPVFGGKAPAVVGPTPPTGPTFEPPGGGPVKAPVGPEPANPNISTTKPEPIKPRRRPPPIRSRPIRCPISRRCRRTTRRRLPPRRCRVTSSPKIAAASTSAV